MDVAARHRSGGMAEHRRDRQFRIAQFACDAPDLMPERVRRYIGPSESVANSAQHSISRDTVRLPAVRGDYIGDAVLNRQLSEHAKRGRAARAEERRVGKDVVRTCRYRWTPLE